MASSPVHRAEIVFFSRAVHSMAAVQPVRVDRDASPRTHGETRWLGAAWPRLSPQSDVWPAQSAAIVKASVESFRETREEIQVMDTHVWIFVGQHTAPPLLDPDAATASHAGIPSWVRPGGHLFSLQKLASLQAAY